MGLRFRDIARGLRSQLAKLRGLKASRKIGLTAVAGTLVFLFQGQVLGTNLVSLKVDGKTSHVRTSAQTVGDFLRENGVAIREFDVVQPSASEDIDEGMSVVVKHAVPVVVKIFRQEIVTVSTAESVGGLLDELDISTKPADKIKPHKSQPLLANMSIEVKPRWSRFEVTRVALPYKTIKTNDANLNRGRTKVDTKGRPGVLLRTAKLTYEGNTLVNRSKPIEKMLSAPVNQVIKVGTRRQLARVFNQMTVSRGQQRDDGGPTGGRTLLMRATAYAPNYGPGVGSRTATGRKAGYGVVAVDPRVIPLGTRLYVKGYGYAIAADTGGAIKGNRIDLCYNTPREAFRFGRRSVTVTILP